MSNPHELSPASIGLDDVVNRRYQTIVSSSKIEVTATVREEEKEEREGVEGTQTPHQPQ